VDGWALLFALLACGIGALIFTYSPAYMHGESGLVRYYAALLAFMGSIVGVALAADLVAIFLFWELTSLASFVLIGYYTADDSSQYAARMAMFITVGGGLFLLVGLLLLSIVAGDVLGPGAAFNLAAMLEESDAMAAALRERGLFLPVLDCSRSARGPSPRRSRCTSGCLTRWRHPRPSRPSSTPRRWSRSASTSSAASVRCSSAPSGSSCSRRSA